MNTYRIRTSNSRPDDEVKADSVAIKDNGSLALKRDDSDGRPRTVVIYPAEEWKGIFLKEEPENGAACISTMEEATQAIHDLAVTPAPEPSEPDLSLWVLKEGERYWTISDGSIYRWRWNNDYMDRTRLRTATIFRTEQQAGSCLAMIRLRQIADTLNEGKVSCCQQMPIYYFIHGDGSIARWWVSPNSDFNRLQLPLFVRKEDAERAKARLKKEGLLKYIVDDPTT